MHQYRTRVVERLCSDETAMHCVVESALGVATVRDVTVPETNRDKVRSDSCRVSPWKWVLRTVGWRLVQICVVLIALCTVVSITPGASDWNTWGDRDTTVPRHDEIRKALRGTPHQAALERPSEINSLIEMYMGPQASPNDAVRAVHDFLSPGRVWQTEDLPTLQRFPHGVRRASEAVQRRMPEGRAVASASASASASDLASVAAPARPSSFGASLGRPRSPLSREEKRLRAYVAYLRRSRPESLLGTKRRAERETRLSLATAETQGSL